LVEDLALAGQEILLADPPAVVGDVFEQLELYGSLTVGQAQARLELIAGQAERLAQRGEGEVARRTYYELVVNCVRLFSPYGHELIEAYDIPYKFATAYVELALQQLEQHRPAIEAEVEAMNSSEYSEEMFDLREALFEIEAALGWWVEVDGREGSN
jgi:hypothetical protein